MVTPDGYDYFAAPAPAARPVDSPPPTGPAFAPPSRGLDPALQLDLAMARSTSERHMGTRGRRLGFLARLEIGLNLLRTSWRVLTGAPVLLVVPLISLLLGCGVVLGYLALAGGPEVLTEGDKLSLALKNFPLALLLSVLGVLSQAVVVDGATSRMQHGRAELATAWARVLGRLPALCGFAVLFALERTISGLLRGRRLGNFLADLFDRAWDFATFLSVPAILYEDVGGLASVKRSGQLVRQRWAAQLVAVGALHLAVLVVALPVLVLAVLIGFSVAPVVGVVMVLGTVLVIVVVANTLNGILSAAMYRYAVTGETGFGFTEHDMWRMFDTSPSL